MAITNKRCKAKTKQGTPCRAAATDGGLCFFHGNPDKVRTLGQAGGRKNRIDNTDLPPLPASVNAAAVREILVQGILDLRANKLAPRAASALGQLCNSLLRVIQVTELEEMIRKLQQQVAELVSSRAVGGEPIAGEHGDEDGISGNVTVTKQ